MEIKDLSHVSIEEFLEPDGRDVGTRFVLKISRRDSRFAFA